MADTPIGHCPVGVWTLAECLSLSSDREGHSARDIGQAYVIRDLLNQRGFEITPIKQDPA